MLSRSSHLQKPELGPLDASYDRGPSVMSMVWTTEWPAREEEEAGGPPELTSAFPHQGLRKQGRGSCLGQLDPKKTCPRTLAT